MKLVDFTAMQYRMIKSAPVDSIVALYKEAGWWKETPEARAVIPGMISGSFCFMAAVEDSGEIVGMGRVISDGVSDAYIQDVVVRKDRRGQGIGRELVTRLAQYCQDHQIEWIGLVAEPGTTPFYSALGFKEMQGYAAMRQM